MLELVHGAFLVIVATVNGMKIGNVYLSELPRVFEWFRTFPQNFSTYMNISLNDLFVSNLVLWQSYDHLLDFRRQLIPMRHTESHLACVQMNNWANNIKTFFILQADVINSWEFLLTWSIPRNSWCDLGIIADVIDSREQLTSSLTWSILGNSWHDRFPGIVADVINSRELSLTWSIPRNSWRDREPHWRPSWIFRSHNDLGIFSRTFIGGHLEFN